MEMACVVSDDDQITQKADNYQKAKKSIYYSITTVTK